MKRYALTLTVILQAAIALGQERQVVILPKDSASAEVPIHLFRDTGGIPAYKNAPIVSLKDYYKTLGVACKAELRIEKATKIPFRFRLGSLQQTDYLEQKPNSQKPGL